MIGLRRPRFGIAASLVATTLLGLCACSPGPVTKSNTTLTVTLRDFRITSSSSTTPPGEVRLLIDDEGPSTHELVVVGTDLAPEQLPLRPDGLTVDEDSALLSNVGELRAVDVGDSARLVLTLSPGGYVLFCNLEGHYLGGMYYRLQVGGNQAEGASVVP